MVDVIVLLPMKETGKAIVPPPSMANWKIGVVAPVAAFKVTTDPRAAAEVTRKVEPVPPLMVAVVEASEVPASTKVPPVTVVAPA